MFRLGDGLILSECSEVRFVVYLGRVVGRDCGWADWGVRGV